MALIERLIGYDATGANVDNHIGPHAFSGAIAERRRGRLTNAQVRDAFSLDGPEQSEALALVNSANTREEVEDVIYLAQEKRAPYNTPAAVRLRLGL